MTVLWGVDADDQSSFDSSAQLFAQAPASTSSSSSQPVSFVTAEQFETMNDKWGEQFACFEALLSRGNMFTIPKTVVSSLPSHTVVSAQPCIYPAARHTGLAVSPAAQEELYKKGEAKTKKKKKKSSKKDKAVPDSVHQTTVSSVPGQDIPAPGDDVDMPEPVFQPI